MSETVSVLAYAKLNLSLDITGVRPDGYHTLEMVMQSVDLYDTVTLTKHSTDKGVSVHCDRDDVPASTDNIAYKAALAFFQYAQIKEYGLTIKIKKRIPLAAGLGGGSADAAAVLVGLNQLYQTDYSTAQLCEVGIKIGADVPFCIYGGTRVAEGTGGIISPLPDLTDCCFVIVKTGEKHSTGEMYQKFDALTDVKHPMSQNLISAICAGEIEEVAKYTDNVFEALWDSEILQVKTELLENGALSASLSGSGPSVFGLFADEETAHKCLVQLEDKYSDVFLCFPVDEGCKINS